jgi:hypothetical protein
VLPRPLPAKRSIWIQPAATTRPLASSSTPGCHRATVTSRGHDDQLVRSEIAGDLARADLLPIRPSNRGATAHANRRTRAGVQGLSLRAASFLPASFARSLPAGWWRRSRLPRSSTQGVDRFLRRRVVSHRKVLPFGAGPGAVRAAPRTRRRKTALEKGRFAGTSEEPGTRLELVTPSSPFAVVSQHLTCDLPIICRHYAPAATWVGPRTEPPDCRRYATIEGVFRHSVHPSGESPVRN